MKEKIASLAVTDELKLRLVGDLLEPSDFAILVVPIDKAAPKGRLTVFITANEDVKIRTLMERHKISESQAKDVMIKTDKKRASYYNYYSSKRWGDSKSYDLCMNSSKIGYDGVVKMIQDFVEIKKGYKK